MDVCHVDWRVGGKSILEADFAVRTINEVEYVRVAVAALHVQYIRCVRAKLFGNTEHNSLVSRCGAEIYFKNCLIVNLRCFVLVKGDFGHGGVCGMSRDGI